MLDNFLWTERLKRKKEDVSQYVGFTFFYVTKVDITRAEIVARIPQ